MKTKFTLILLLLIAVISNSNAQEEAVIEPEHVPFQISFIPGFGTAGFQAYRVSTNVSINILAGYVHSVQGLEMGGLVNYVHKDVTGVQMSGVINVVGQNVRGLQMAGLSNVVIGEAKGAQLSGLTSVTIKHMQGGQMAGLVNYAKSVNGFQSAGLLSASVEKAKGGQVSGLANYAESVKGIQAAGLINVAAKEVDGAQVAGLLNFAPKVKGLQIGVVNIADTVESGAMIGIFNFVRKGMHKFEVSHEDVTDFNFSFRGGTHRFYSILSIGLTPQDQAFWSTGAGFGTQIDLKAKLYTNIEATSNWPQLTEKPRLNGTYWLNKVNVNIGYKINDYLSINGGPVLNIYIQDVKNDDETALANIGNNGFYDRMVNDSRVKMWLGYRVAFRF